MSKTLCIHCQTILLAFNGLAIGYLLLQAGWVASRYRSRFCDKISTNLGTRSPVGTSSGSPDYGYPIVRGGPIIDCGEIMTYGQIVPYDNLNDPLFQEDGVKNHHGLVYLSLPPKILID